MHPPLPPPPRTLHPHHVPPPPTSATTHPPPMTMSLPPPSENQTYCHISALEAGHLELPLRIFIENPPIPRLPVPSLAFLLRHSQTNKNLVFDLGIRRDWESTLPPAAVKEINQFYTPMTVPQSVVESLAKGGLSASDIHTVCLSHLHFDHIGDTRPFTTSTFVVGDECKSLLSPGYPADPDAPVASDLLPEGRTKFLSGSDYAPLGPFPRAHDLYGDGSLYIIDSPGHLPGHVNILTRTSPDGAWVYLAGDSAHHWRLITGESDVPIVKVGDISKCAHVDKELSKQHLSRIRELLNVPRVKILLAHEEQWYKENMGGSAFWPGEIPSL
ncbi:hypothetical protein AX17_005006 [Amanita inopinata Kibby_2008]|nr:hypothetical protein AX17_005006 [Amanita inopinata Kibby_2008]